MSDLRTDPDETVHWVRFRTNNRKTIHTTRDCFHLSKAKKIVSKPLSWLLHDDGTVPDNWSWCEWCADDGDDPISGHTKPSTTMAKLEDMDPDELPP